MALKKIEEMKDATLQAVLKEFSNEQKVALHRWASDAQLIVVNKNLEKKKKIEMLSALPNAEIARSVLDILFKVSKGKIWDNQSWARRIGFGGLAFGAMTFGGTGVGIATLGAGIGLPLALLSAGGGVILGSIIDEVSKELENKEPLIIKIKRDENE